MLLLGNFARPFCTLLGCFAVRIVFWLLRGICLAFLAFSCGELLQAAPASCGVLYNPLVLGAIIPNWLVRLDAGGVVFEDLTNGAFQMALNCHLLTRQPVTRHRPGSGTCGAIPGAAAGALCSAKSRGLRHCQLWVPCLQRTKRGRRWSRSEGMRPGALLTSIRTSI